MNKRTTAPTFLHNETPSYEHVDQNKNQETLVVHDLRHDSLTKDGSNVIHSSSTNDGKSCIRGVYGGYIKTFQSTMQLIRTKSVLLLLLQGVPGCIPWGVVNTYLNDYLSEDQGMSIEVNNILLRNNKFDFILRCIYSLY